ncbi:hypothetical protein [Dokdonia sp.]|uniref:hypothetical protein n=1 Tax=Dokdonia sp. TaxID=2024995 RepID=UPI0032664607
MRKLIALFFVIAGIYGCEDIVSVPDISEDIITVLAPTDGAILENTDVTFTWEEIEFSDQYQIQVAQPTFENANQVVLDTILGDSLQSFRSFTKTLPSEMYQWRVRGLNSNFQTDYTTQSFTLVDTIAMVGDISSEVVTTIAPSDGVTISSGAIGFSWEAVADATSYQIQIAFPNFENPVQIVNDTITSELSYMTMLDSNSYEWRIKAINEVSETVYATQTLFVEDDVSPLSDQTVTLLSPEDNFETTDTMIPLSWEMIEQATLYRVVITDLSDDSIFLEQTVTTTDITIDFVTGMYSWAVRAENDSQNTPFTQRMITIL